MELLNAIVRAVETRQRFVVATIVGFKGSTPRKPGSRILVFENGGTSGSVGGGALEKEVIAHATALFSSRSPELRDYDLTKELAMCCGGIVSVFFEYVGPSDRLYLFGAGHIAHALASAAELAGFSVTVIDERPELLTAERFPNAEKRIDRPLEDAMKELVFDGEVSIVVCTHDHQLDQRVVEAVLSKPFRYLGLIASVVKATKTRARLKAAGFNDDQIHRLRSPMGFEIGGETPGEIAVSVLAELIAYRRGKRTLSLQAKNSDFQP